MHDGVLYSFADLRKSQCELGAYCEKLKATARIVSDVPPRVVTELLNVCRDLTLFNRGLDCRRERFFFPLSLLGKPSTNKFSFTSLQGKPEERTLIYVQNTDGRQERKHHAVKLTFGQDGGQVYLQIEPDWQFSFPRRISSEERKARLISEKASLRNKDYLYLPHFWRQYLSLNTDRIPLLISSNPIFGNIEFASRPVNYILPFRMINDYFGPKRTDVRGS